MFRRFSLPPLQFRPLLYFTCPPPSLFLFNRILPPSISQILVCFPLSSVLSFLVYFPPVFMRFSPSALLAQFLVVWYLGSFLPLNLSGRIQQTQFHRPLFRSVPVDFALLWWLLIVRGVGKALCMLHSQLLLLVTGLTFAFRHLESSFPLFLLASTKLFDPEETL